MIYRHVLLGCALFLTACSGGSPDDARSSAAAADFQGPNALCTDIERVANTPPDDLTPWQIRVAENSRKACRLPSDDITQAMAETALGEDSLAVSMTENTLTIFARSAETEQRACCSLQPSLLPVAQTEAGNIFAGRYRLADLGRARLEFMRPDFSGDPIVLSGAAGPTDLYLNAGELSGTHAQGVFYSAALDEKRAYQIYTPPNFQAGDDVGLVVLADGVSLAYYIRQWEPLILDGTAAPFAAIGVLSGDKAIVDPDPERDYDFDIRATDYLRHFKHGPKRFDAHLKFVTDELIPHVAADLKLPVTVETTAVFGGSNGGSFAIWAALLRPDVFGHAVGMSPSGPVAEALSPDAVSRNYYLSAGLYEPNFMTNAQFYAEALKAAGARVDFKTYADGHSAHHRALRMVDVLPKIFPP